MHSYGIEGPDNIGDVVPMMRELVERGYRDEISVLKALELIANNGIDDPSKLFQYIYIHNHIYREYRSKSTRRKKSRALEEV